MTVENHQLDKKSIRALSDISELAKDAVGFANASGGELHIGIEDDADAPPATQRVEDAQVAQLNKRIGELTVHVSYTAQKVTHDNGGEFIRVQVSRNHGAPSSMTDGTYLIRDGDRTRPLRPDELSRFMTDRPSFDWELIATTHSASAYDAALFARFAERIRTSDRVTAFVKAKSNEELLQHYLFVRDGKLTNLGALCVGTREQRAMLNTAPVVQCIKYDDRGQKVRKWVWDDFSLTPWELVDAIWQEIPEWQESYELPDGLFRKHVPVYDEVVVRELLANALVHRPYTQRGDIFINLHPDRL
ncbi:MAG: ATP-binding protein, partial [Rickettsiales bacterium]